VCQYSKASAVLPVVSFPVVKFSNKSLTPIYAIPIVLQFSSFMFTRIDPEPTPTTLAAPAC